MTTSVQYISIPTSERQASLIDMKRNNIDNEENVNAYNSLFVRDHPHPHQLTNIYSYTLLRAIILGFIIFLSGCWFVVYNTNNIAQRSSQNPSPPSIPTHYSLSTLNAFPRYDQDKENKKIIFITGITGMIGSHVARYLVHHHPNRNDIQVYGLIRPRSDLYNIIDLRSHLRLIVGDITDPFRMLDIIRNEIPTCPHYIYHFAAQAINSYSNGSPVSTLDNNLYGTMNILESIVRNHCQNRTIFIFASSSTVYGRSADVYSNGHGLDELIPADPVTKYGTSKKAGEVLCQEYNNKDNVQVIILRFFIQIGRGGTTSLSIQQFAQQIALAERNEIEPILYHGNLNTYRDISDVEQTAPLIVQVAETSTTDAQIYNIGSAQSISIEQLIHTIIQLSHISIQLQPDPRLFRSYDEQILLADNKKLLTLLGPKTIYPIMNLKHTVQNILDDWRRRVDITNTHSSINKPLSVITMTSEPNKIPVLARVVHLITVENMEEVKEFIDLLPSLTSDIVFNCWGDSCYDSRSKKPDQVYVGSWHSNGNYPYRMNKKGEIESFDRFQDILITQTIDKDQDKYWEIQPMVYFINELSLNLSRHTTLTESRNRLAAFIQPQEVKQGWKWAYINIMDGDGHLACPFLPTVDINHHLWKGQFNRWKISLINEDDEVNCWLAFNAFLLTTGVGIGLPVFFEPHPEWLGSTIMTFHFDGVIAAFHHSLFHLVHPLCEKFDSYTYWSSQAYLILQSVCFIGHVYTNTYFQALNADHRSYPHNDPFGPFTDITIKEMNIFPERLSYFQKYLQSGNSYKPFLTPLPSLNFYPGFNLETMIDIDCITHIVDPKTCVQNSILKEML